MGRNHRKTLGQHENPPFVEVNITELFAHTSKNTHPNQNKQLVPPKKKGPLFERDVFSEFGESKHGFHVKHLDFFGTLKPPNP